MNLKFWYHLKIWNFARNWMHERYIDYTTKMMIRLTVWSIIGKLWFSSFNSFQHMGFDSIVVPSKYDWWNSWTCCADRWTGLCSQRSVLSARNRSNSTRSHNRNQCKDNVELVQQNRIIAISTCVQRNQNPHNLTRWTHSLHFSPHLHPSHQ